MKLITYWKLFIHILNIMIGGFANALTLQEDDITKMLAATTHIGSENSETTMEQYVFKKRNNGKQASYIFLRSRNSKFCSTNNLSKSFHSSMICIYVPI